MRLASLNSRLSPSARLLIRLSSSTTASPSVARLAHLRRKMSFQRAYGYVEAPELAELLKKKQAASDKSVAVVDVRDDDFEGGNIPGAINVPSTVFSEALSNGSILKDLAPYDKVVFHCHLSQQRGPKAARMYAEAAEAKGKEGAAPAAAQSGGEGEGKKQEVLVLRDGFAGFGTKYKDDPALVEKWDEESWKFR